MIRGLGTDVIEIARVDAGLKRHGRRFAARILSKDELARWDTFTASRQVEFTAGRFAAKEAISKALGIGIGRLSMPTVTITQSNDGIALHWHGHHHTTPYATDRWHISISHSTTIAFATAVWEVCT